MPRFSCALLFALLAAVSITAAAQSRSSIAKSPCPVAIPAGVTAECLKLTVPENRARPASRLISMPVVIVKSTATAPKPDPIIYTGGGPGGGSLGMVRGAANLVPYTSERDFIIFEQRGTAMADPSLTCPEVTEAIRGAFGRYPDPDKEYDAEAKAAARCFDRLTRSGADLSAYNSRESAADLDDLRRLLGVEKWNLYSISYGTRLVVNYARQFPQHTRSLILDSVLPADANWDETGVANILDVLKHVLSACAADPMCSAKYPDLERRMFQTVADLDKHPAEVEVEIDGSKRKIQLFGRHFIDLLYNLAEGNGSLQWIPSTVDKVSRKDFDPLKSYAKEQLTGSGFIWGMRYSVWCGEEMPFQNRSKIAASTKRSLGLGGFISQGGMPTICSQWKVSQADRSENSAVDLKMPVLAFGGEFDPDTPFDWAESVAKWSSNGYSFKVKSTTHGTMNRKCTFVDIPIAFLNDPLKRPDDTCLASIPPIVFK